MRSRATCGVLVALLGIGLCFAQRLEAQCNWAGDAAAGIQAADGRVTSSHFGQITNVECIHSRTMILRAKTLLDGQQVASHDKIDGEATLGAWLDHTAQFFTCEGTWNSATRFGTRYLGINDWLDSDTSGLTNGYCLPDDGGGGGGGGDGGVGGCSAAPTETTTYTLTADGVEEAAGGEAGSGLSRSVVRPEGRFLAEEWAVISSSTGERRVEFASSDRFVAHLERAPRLVQRRAGEGSTTLVVEASAHPLNHRYMPTPALAELRLAVDWPSRAGGQEFWFRAEVAEAGGVDRLLLLDSSDPAGHAAVREAIEDRLDLQHADARRHRTVVFGRAVVSPAGTLSVEDSIVVVPQCCCGTEEVFCL